MEPLVAQERYWKKVGLASFVLAAFVIVRHNSSFANYGWGQGAWLQSLPKGTITEIAVPLFFAIAGFNFFQNYSPQKAWAKIRRRIKSLLIPYIAWNTIYCVFVVVTSCTFISRFFIGRERFVPTLPNVVLGCLYHWNCNSQFWFIFDLMLLALVSPLLWYLVRDKRVGFVTLLVACAAVFNLSFPLLEKTVYRMDALLYYLVGAVAATSFRDEVYSERLSTFLKQSLGCAGHAIVGVALMCTSLLLPSGVLPVVARPVVILLSSMGLWTLCGMAVQGRVSRIPSGGETFLLYAAHGILQPVIVKLLWLVLPKWEWMGMVNFALSIATTIVLIIWLRKEMQSRCPVLDHVLTGWRR